MANTLFTIFLSLKNTPLAWVTDWSYERLNILHQVAGYSAIVHVIIHTGTYTYYFISEDRAAVLRRPSVIAGIAAGFAFLILGVSGVIVRRWWYELFYYLHVFSWVVGIVMLGLHQPELTKKLIYVTIASAGIWALDRLIRVSRLLLYSANNSVVLTPLPHGGTRVTLTKSPVAAKSGQHCFLWIPSIRTFETHPFTIASMDPLEFVVASYDGFTGDLHDHAVSNPGISLRASVEGSYGAVPNTARFDKIIFVSGGSGASFTFGMALNALKKMSADCNKELIFIWFIKQRSKLPDIINSTNGLLSSVAYCEWFLSQLQTLRADSRVTVRIFATREAGVELGPAETAGGKSISHCVSSDSEGSISPPTPVASCPSSLVSTDTEKAAMCILGRQNDPLSIHDIPVTPGRPDVAVMVDEEMRKSSADQNVLVLGCGPDAMMAQVRNATASCIRPNGPAVELHCEQFGW